MVRYVPMCNCICDTCGYVLLSVPMYDLTVCVVTTDYANLCTIIYMTMCDLVCDYECDYILYYILYLFV